MAVEKTDPSLSNVNEKTSKKTPPNHDQKIIEEQKRLTKLMNDAAGSDYKQSYFWTQNRRRVLESFTVHLIVAISISGLVLFLISELWCYFLGSVIVVFRPTEKPPTKKVEVKSYFLKEIKYAEQTFTIYSLGCLLLFVAAWSALLTFSASYKRRSCRLLVSILLFLLATGCMVVAPLPSMLARNTDAELKLLKQDEQVAYQEGVKGSFQYFRNGQCKNFEDALLNKDTTQANEMRIFCHMLLRYAVMMYFMNGTAIIPIIAAIVCLLELIVNKKSWSSKSLRNYKERTQGEMWADRCNQD